MRIEVVPLVIVNQKGFVIFFINGDLPLIKDIGTILLAHFLIKRYEVEVSDIFIKNNRTLYFHIIFERKIKITTKNIKIILDSAIRVLKFI